MELRTNQHSVFRLNYHLIMCIAFPELKNSLWKDSFWSQSFCLITVGGAPLSVIKEYIQNQGQPKE